VPLAVGRRLAGVHLIDGGLLIRVLRVEATYFKNCATPLYSFGVAPFMTRSEAPPIWVPRSATWTMCGGCFA